MPCQLTSLYDLIHSCAYYLPHHTHTHTGGWCFFLWLPGSLLLLLSLHTFKNTSLFANRCLWANTHLLTSFDCVISFASHLLHLHHLHQHTHTHIDPQSPISDSFYTLFVWCSVFFARKQENPTCCCCCCGCKRTNWSTEWTAPTRNCNRRRKPQHRCCRRQPM